MGWKYSPETEITWSYWDGPRGFMHLTLHWQPLHNEAHAAEVRERMRELGWWWEILTSDTRDHIALEHRLKGVRFTAGKVAPGAIPRAICHAALLALGLAKEEEL